MPDRLVRIPARKLMAFVSGHEQLVVAILMFALVIALGIAVAGWAAARNAEQRITKIELDRIADKAVAEQGKKISQVTTCFNAAKQRPLLTTVLRALSGAEHDPAARSAFDQLILEYETAPTPGINGTPTDESCTALAKRLGVNPNPYRSQG